LACSQIAKSDGCWLALRLPRKMAVGLLSDCQEKWLLACSQIAKKNGC